MSAIRLLQAERKEEIQHLHRQFMSGGILQRELWEEAEKFLIQREIYDVILAEEQDLREYKQTLLDSGKLYEKAGERAVIRITEDTEVLDRNRIWRATLRNPRKPSVR